MAWTARPDGTNEFMNKRWAEFTGLSAEDTAGSGWMAAVHPEDRQILLDKWRASLNTGEPLEFEARVRSRRNRGISLASGSWRTYARCARKYPPVAWNSHGHPGSQTGRRRA